MTAHDMLAAARAAATAPPAPTLDAIRRWPATVDIPTACTAYGLSKSHGYALAGQGSFPARVLRVGKSMRVVTASIIASLEAQDGGSAA